MISIWKLQKSKKFPSFWQCSKLGISGYNHKNWTKFAEQVGFVKDLNEAFIHNERLHLYFQDLESNSRTWNLIILPGIRIPGKLWLNSHPSEFRGVATKILLDGHSLSHDDVTRAITSLLLQSLQIVEKQVPPLLLPPIWIIPVKL